MKESFSQRSRIYHEALPKLLSLIDGEWDPVLRMASFSSLLFHACEWVSWCGFYRREGRELVVGPYVGKPACVRIPFNRGVCGDAASRGKPCIVSDVHAFDEHIACDPESRSELVIPVFGLDGEIEGVLDLDSMELAAFSAEDAAVLTQWIETVFPRGGVAIRK